MAALTESMQGCAAMRAGSLTVSVRSMRSRSFPSAHR